jgi:FkbH-like protein
MRALEYPLDADDILRHRRRLRRELLEDQRPRQPLRVAVLGGSTTGEVVRILELFLLNRGLAPVFYESEANRYQEAVLADDSDLFAFSPDIVYLHTSLINLRRLPGPRDSEETLASLLAAEMARFEQIWDRIERHAHCAIVQNNFEPPPTRPLGNLDAYAPQGRVRFVNELNRRFADAAARRQRLFLNDINYLSARLGLDRWWSPAALYSYGYALSLQAIPHLCHNLAAIMAALTGRGRKSLVVDLDNTIWGGVIGEDGLAGIRVSPGDPVGEAHRALQDHLDQLSQRGILLAVCSKNDRAVALEGFTHPDMMLGVQHFSSFKAGWDPKPGCLSEIARELHIGAESLVFLDDSPAERALVERELPDVAVLPVPDAVEYFLPVLDRSGYFEPALVADEDRQRAAWLRNDAEREHAARDFTDLAGYLHYLEMKAEICLLSDVDAARAWQLVQKTNQFNLTGRRYTLGELEELMASPDHVILGGRLSDRFGCHGLTSVVVIALEGATARIDLWIMSCRVLQRQFELAMFDSLIQSCCDRGAVRLLGPYVPSARNQMVAGLYESLGFAPQGELWSLALAPRPAPRNEFIEVVS